MSTSEVPIVPRKSSKQIQLRRQRTIQIYISSPAVGEHPVDVPVEIVWPEGKQPAEVPGLARYPAERLRYERDFYNRGLLGLQMFFLTFAVFSLSFLGFPT